MASLSQTLRKPNQLTRGPGGTLQQTTTLADAAEKTGVAAAPTTPGGAEMIGADPQAAKMAGTPQQLSAALTKSAAEAAPESQLSTALRRQQARTEQTEAETQKVQKSVAMQNLGSLGDRVTNFINTQKDLMTTAKPVELEAQAPAPGGPDVSAELAALKANPQDMEAVLAINKKLGKDANSLLTGDQIREMYASDISTIGKAAGGAMADRMTVDNLLSDNQFGYDSATLSNLLGVPEEELRGYTVDQLQAKVNQVAEQEFGQAGQLATKEVDPFAGQAERALAQQQSRELSATGLRSTEQDVQRLNEQVQRGDTVSFGGQQMQLADALADDNISSLVKDYIEGDDDFRKMIDKSEPQLSQFIKQNQALLQDAASKMEAGTSQFRQIQQENKALQTQGGQQIDESIMKTLFPEWGKLSSTKLDADSKPLLKTLKQMPAEDAAKMVGEVNTALQNKRIDPKELTALSQNELKELGIGQGPATPWARYITNEQTRERINSLDPADTDTLLNEVFSGAPTKEQLNSIITAGNSVFALGLGDKPDVSVLDINGDGKPDWDSTQSILLNKLRPKIPLSQAVTGNFPTGKTPLPKVTEPKEGTIERSLYLKLGEAGADGKIDEADLNNNAANLSLDELIKLESLSKSPKASIDPAVTKFRQQATDQRTTDAFNYQTGPMGKPVLEAALAAWAENQDPNYTSKKVLSDAIDAEMDKSSEMKAALSAGGGGIGNVSRMLEYVTKMNNGGLASAKSLQIASILSDKLQSLNDTQKRLAGETKDERQAREWKQDVERRKKQQKGSNK